MTAVAGCLGRSRKAVLCLACIFVSHAAHARDQVRLFYGKSTDSTFRTAIFGDFDASQESNYVVGANWGRQLTDSLLGLPLPTTANLGLQYFNERGHQDDGHGVTAFVKIHYSWRLPFTEKRVRLGLGEGLSYASPIPISEQRKFTERDAESRRLVNYLEWTVDVGLRQFAALDALIPERLEDVHVGFMVWHRSTVFGLFGDTYGGINFMGLGFEAQF